MPVKKANARRVEAHHRILNKKNRVDSNLLVKHSVSVSDLNSVCGAYYTGDTPVLSQLMRKVIGTVNLDNDEYALSLAIGQFCDGGLEVAFRQHSCHIRNYDMVDLLKGSRTTNLYSISLNDMMSASPVCLLIKASSTKSWLWHRRLNHLNFGTLNELARKNLNGRWAKYETGTLMEAARTMLSFEKAPQFLWAEGLGHCGIRCFGSSLCYPTNEPYDDVGKLRRKADIGIFVWRMHHQEVRNESQQTNRKFRNRSCCLRLTEHELNALHVRPDRSAPEKIQNPPMSPSY
ncbi:integrase, catalytic region, zinc finger, CCHC-type containing protein [Tanacetum coccineum]